MHVEKVDISNIDLSDHTYLIGDPSPDNRLKESINSLGQINPVVLISKESSFTVVTGRKRILALEEIGSKSVAAKIHPFEKNKIPDFLFTIYFDNKQRFTDLEKAELICKFKGLCGFSDSEILDSVLSKLSIKPSKNNLKKFISVASLDHDIKKLFYDDYFTFEQLVMLSEIENQEYRKVVFEKILKTFRFNNNETREILREVYEIAKRDKISFDKCIDEIFDEIGNNPNKNEFKKKVRIMRYPNLMKVEEKFKESSKELKSIKNLNLSHHPFFETNEIELRLKVNDIDEYIEILEKLSDSAITERIERLLKLIKVGE